jgi:hypothetical protein
MLNYSFQMALFCLQRTIRNFMIGKIWPWWQLWLAIKPNLRSSKFAEIKATLEAKTHEAEKKFVGVTATRKKAEAVNERLADEKAVLEDIINKGDTAVKEMEDKTRKVEQERKQLDTKVSSCNLL